MATMNISLPDSMKDFVDEQVKQRGYSTTSEYVRELILKDQDRLRLRRHLLSGAASAQGRAADHAYFEGGRRSISSAERKKALDQVVIASEDVDGYDLA
jgi:antitoxin ParD1/3/4